MFVILLICFFCVPELLSNMCVHNIDRGSDNLGRKVYNLLGPDLDVFDSCDYIDSAPDKSQGSLSIVQINIRGIYSKKSELIDLLDNVLENNQPDAILISETWLTPKSPDIIVPGYRFIHKPRLHKRGGGVGILLTDNIRYKLVSGIKFKSVEYESCFTELLLRNGESMLIGSIYRPPNTNIPLFDEEYNEILCSIKKRNYKYTVIGMDHNLDFLKSHLHHGTEKFIQTNLDHMMYPTITRPTRISHTSATLIDNIFISQNLCGTFYSGIIPNDMSDHLPSICVIDSVQCPRKAPVKILSRDTRKRNLDLLRSGLVNVDWSVVTEQHDVNNSMEKLHGILQDKVEKYIPEREHVVKGSKIRREKWVSPGILHSINYCKKLYKKTLSAKCDIKAKEKYKNYSALLCKLKRGAKKEYYSKMCTEYRSNIKKLWKIINEVSGKTNDKTQLIDSLKIGKFLESNGNKIANAFGKYFSGVGEKFAKKIPSSKKSVDEYLRAIRLNDKTLFLMPSSKSEIGRLIRDLPRKSSSGFDNISNILLKEVRDELIEPLLHIFNTSLNNGQFPEIMKLAEIVPLFKSKERFLESNYRPISLLTTMSKLLEKLVCTRVYKFLDKTGQIVETQYGFREKHSCDHAISHLVGTIIKNLEKKNTTIGLFLDLSKAFDTLEHRIILQKMYRYGIRGQCLSWFESYLRNRKMRVKCSPTSTGTTVRSECFEINYGTPQGSCLGPLIFLIFCNDLQLHLQFMTCFQFADDTTLIMGHRNVYYLKYCVEIDLINIQDWFYANKLTLNLEKSVYLLFNSTTKSNLKIVLNGVTLQRSKTVKFLGIWIDDELSWKEHITKLCLKLNTKLGLLLRSKNFLTLSAMKTLYYAQFHSILTYALLAWGPMLEQVQLNRLQSIQNKAIKALSKNANGYEAFYKEQKILNVKQLINLHELKFGYQLCSGMLPKPLEACVNCDHDLKSNLKLHNYNTRQKLVPNLPKVQSNMYRRSLLFTSLRIISSIPNQLREVKPFKLFVKRCKQYLLTR